MPAFRGETQCGTRAELWVIKSRGNKKIGESDQDARDKVGKVNNDQNLKFQVSHIKELGFYPKGNEDTLNNFQ